MHLLLLLLSLLLLLLLLSLLLLLLLLLLFCYTIVCMLFAAWILQFCLLIGCVGRHTLKSFKIMFTKTESHSFL